MSETTVQIAIELGRTTAVLAGMALVVFGLLRGFRVSSPVVHRVAWCLVLVQGWFWIRLPLDIPYHDPVAVPTSVSTTEPEPAADLANPIPRPSLPADLVPSIPPIPPMSGPSLVQNEPLDTELIEIKAPNDDCRRRLPSPTASEPISASDCPSDSAMGAVFNEEDGSTNDSATGVASGSSATSLPAVLDCPANSATGVASYSDDTQEPVEGRFPSWTVAATWLVLFWTFGMIGSLVMGLWRYVRFVRRLPAGRPAEEAWVAQWQTLLDEQAVRRAIPLRVTEEIGPLLCRLPGRFELLVPGELWAGLTPAQRLPILRHELAHYQRADLWKSLFVRFLALPHWFNPAVWWAVRRFDEAAEWACDRAAVANAPDHATRYADALLRLVESPGRTAFGPAARGGGLSRRIRRLLTSHPLEDSIMKRLCVLGVAVMLVAAGSVQVALVAKEPAATPPSMPANSEPLEEESPSPANEAASTSLPSTISADAKDVGATAKPENKKKPLIDKLHEERLALLREAEKVARLAYEHGTGTIEELYVAQQARLQAELATCRDPAKRLEIHQQYVDSLKASEDRVKVLYEAGTPGGEYKTLLRAKTRRLEAEIALLEARAEAASAKANKATAARAGDQANSSTPPASFRAAQPTPSSPPGVRASGAPANAFRRLTAKLTEEAAWKAWVQGKGLPESLVNAVRHRCKTDIDTAATPAEKLQAMRVALVRYEGFGRHLRYPPRANRTAEEDHSLAVALATLQAEQELLKKQIANFKPSKTVTQEEARAIRNAQRQMDAATRKEMLVREARKETLLLAVKREEEAARKAWEKGTVTMDVLLAAMRKRGEKEVDFASSVVEKLQAMQEAVKRHKEFEKQLIKKKSADLSPEETHKLFVDLTALQQQRLLWEANAELFQTELSRAQAAERKERRYGTREAQKQEEAVLETWEQGHIVVDVVLDTMRRRIEAEYKSASSPAERVKVIKAGIARIEEVQRKIQSRRKANVAIASVDRELEANESAAREQVNLLNTALKLEQAVAQTQASDVPSTANPLNAPTRPPSGEPNPLRSETTPPTVARPQAAHTPSRTSRTARREKAKASLVAEKKMATIAEEAKAAYHRVRAAQKEEEAAQKAWEQDKSSAKTLADAMRKRWETEANAAISPVEKLQAMRESLARFEKLTTRCRQAQSAVLSPEEHRELVVALNALIPQQASLEGNIKVLLAEISRDPSALPNAILAAQKREEAVVAVWEKGNLDFDIVRDAMDRRLDVELQTASSPAERVNVTQTALVRQRKIGWWAEDRLMRDMAKGRTPDYDRLHKNSLAMIAQCNSLAATLKREQAEAKKILDTLRYDGMSFQQWRDTAQTELKPERRTETIRAFGAFASKGYGQEAVKAILEIMRDYDGKTPGSKGIDDMRQLAWWIFSDAVTPHVPLELGVPLLREELEHGPRNGRFFAAETLLILGSDAKPALTALVMAADKDKDASVRQKACYALLFVDKNGQHLDVVQRFVEQNPQLANNVLTMLGNNVAVEHDAKKKGPTRVKPVVTMLVGLSKDKSGTLRYAAIDALRPLLSIHEVEQALIEAASHEDAHTRFLALTKLADANVKGEIVIPLLVKAIEQEAVQPSHEDARLALLVKLHNYTSSFVANDKTWQAFQEALPTIKKWADDKTDVRFHRQVQSLASEVSNHFNRPAWGRSHATPRPKFKSQPPEPRVSNPEPRAPSRTGD
ncbi:MAG: hypothetical protein JW818_08115 [Pirellulales bacterium]|nr:hypothetical protein [Pirellulales bacterium]